MISKSGESARVVMPKIPARFTGTGDLFTALLLAWGHEGLQVNTHNQIIHLHDSYTLSFTDYRAPGERIVL